MRTPTEVASYMAASAISPEVQIHQTGFRMRLVESWGIPEGPGCWKLAVGKAI
jgi:hypothetical protein